MNMHETYERAQAFTTPAASPDRLITSLTPPLGEPPADPPAEPPAELPAEPFDRTPNPPLTPTESLDLLYAVIEGAGSYLLAYSDADGERLASALRSTFRIVERAAREC